MHDPLNEQTPLRPVLKEKEPILVVYRLIKYEGTQEALDQQIVRSLTGTKEFGDIKITAYTLPHGYTKDQVAILTQALEIIQRANLDGLFP